MKNHIKIYLVDGKSMELEFRMSKSDSGEPSFEFVIVGSEPETTLPVDSTLLKQRRVPVNEIAAQMVESQFKGGRAEKFEAFTLDEDGKEVPDSRKEGYFNLEYPTLARMARSFTDATAKWWKAGRPVRSEEEVERIFTDICTPCKYFDNTKSKARCKICGCALQKKGIVSKLKMATESCPKGFW